MGNDFSKRAEAAGRIVSATEEIGNGNKETDRFWFNEIEKAEKDLKGQESEGESDSE